MKRTAEARATDALWWAGWRPVAVGSIGAVAGVLAGYVAGAVGPATTGVGVVVISLGVLSALVRRLGFVSAVVAFFVFYVVGPGRAQQGLEATGVGTNWAEFVAEFVLNIGSLVGVEASREPVAVVGGGAASVALWSLGGAALGGVVWVAGVYAVNSGYGEVYHGFVDGVKEEGHRLLGDDGFHTFTHGEDTLSLVSSAKKYHATNLLVGESSLSLHHGSTVDMVRRDEEVSNSTKELYYDQVASVDYETPFLKIRMSDGQVVKIVTSGKPVEVIDEIEERLMRYKSSPGSEGDGAGVGDVGRDSEEPPDGGDETPGGDGGAPNGDDETPGGDDQDGDADGIDEGSEAFGSDIVDEVDEALEAFDEALGEEEEED
ncbi:hypothetical protein EGH25_00930 [Haladaptatus sp. F3-133]|jgi:hypothetical protein|uniref:Uncharacterized protein n=1 Tax=Halorutilus salinus TaxID=2487751 RepID=A0A9Q4GF98_9EURY|nr:hypothetical protein [Halorutilus salinus]MCX2817924.1 hypothetical protein [Halorutilus salinus]